MKDFLQYSISDEFLMIKALFKKPESVSLLREFINNNKIIKKYLIFNVSIIFYNSSQIINKTVRTEYKEKLRSEIYKKLKLEKSSNCHSYYFFVPKKKLIVYPLI